MSFKSFIKQGFIACAPTDTVERIAQLMREHNTGAVVIADDADFMSYVTELDTPSIHPYAFGVVYELLADDELAA